MPELPVAGLRHMIDWWTVAISFLWILGLAALLAAFSYTYWLRGLNAASWSQVLSTPFIRLSLALGFALFALGPLVSVGQWLERIGWAGVMVIALWQAVSAWQARHMGTV